MDKINNLKEYNFTETSFNFVNEGVKIADQKLSTKPTTFAKDSFKRFCKNKSSVVAAIILGILILLAMFVPVFSNADTDRVSAAEQFLEPKLFEAGTGFWDGTRKYKKSFTSAGEPAGVLYDFENETPAGFYKPAVMNLVVDETPTLINSASPYGKGGYVMMENQNTSSLENIVMYSDLIPLQRYSVLSAEISMLNVDGVMEGTLGEYRVVFADDEQSVVLKDWSTDYTDYKLNISSALLDAGIESMTGRLSFELKADADKYTYILIKSCEFVGLDDGTSSVAITGNAKWQAASFTDATAMVLKAKDALGVFPEGYWSCTGRKGIYASEVYFCEFVYDTYAAAYDATEVTYGRSDLEKFIKDGLCKYDAAVGTSSFVKLSDECPIDEIVDQKLNSITGKLIEVKALSYRYKQMGYKTMPKFIFGTDISGVDVFTRMFKGLRTSLLLGICTFAFCFLFGLVWGSISGYFGGAVDLAMERFCDILGGIPWIVIMTLCILHLGNNFLTFFLALCMTGWMGTAGGTRTQFYRFKHMEYVLASRTLGSNDLRLIFKHILPNSLGTIVTSSVLMIPSVIFSEATLAYLNLGLQGVTSFGVMLSDNQRFLASYSYLIVIPSVVMALLMISFNLFGNGLRDAINPTLKGA